MTMTQRGEDQLVSTHSLPKPIGVTPWRTCLAHWIVEMNKYTIVEMTERTYVGIMR